MIRSHGSFLRIFLGIALLCLLAQLAPGPGSASAELTGRQIMDRVDARDTGDNGISTMEMTLVDRRGNERVRRLRSFTKKKGDDDQNLIFFLAPADVKNTGFLTYDFDDPDRDDDQWLYLPALKKTKRIASSDKSGSFMGSDFTYADMSSRALDRYEYTLMKSTEVGGVPVWQVEAIPNEVEADETGYTKLIFFVRKDNFYVIRSVSWVEKGGRLKYLDVKSLEQVDGIWVATEMTMTTKKGKSLVHKTILRQQDTKFNQDLSEDYFSVRQLEKGP